MRNVLSLDIGGANLKAAHVDGTARSIPFAVWKQPGELGGAAAELIAGMPTFDVLAVTMTAELCDCFETKAAGVDAVLDAVESATARLGRPALVRVWFTDGRLVSAAAARAEPLKAAASNWLALATWAGRLCPHGPALLIDVGSTTTDIIPLCDGVPVPVGRTDLERLSGGELVYSGVRRTPVFALLHAVQLRGRICRIAAELFATTRDVYLWLGDLPDAPDDRDTADGRPAMRDCARTRLARVVCADGPMLTDADVDSIAQQMADAQLRDLVAARRQVEAALGEPPKTVVLAGSGEFLARRVSRAGALRPGPQPDGDPSASVEHVQVSLISLTEKFGVEISSAACAYALAVLASERIGTQYSVLSTDQPPATAPSSQASGPASIVVVKVGGSLLDLPDLGNRLHQRLATLGTKRIIVVVGGGLAADVIRERDRMEQLGDEKSHWLAIRALTFNSMLIEAVLPNARVVARLSQCEAMWDGGEVPILDPHAFLADDETSGGSPLPHTWDVTSDSIAARVAIASQADVLLLLKSTTWPPDRTLDDAAREGVVDPHLPRELKRRPNLRVQIENLRAATVV